MKLSSAKVFAVLAREAERRVSEFNAQGLANTAWAFATVRLRDEKLFMALAREAERRVSELNAQSLANTAWAFATVNVLVDEMFTALATSGAASEQVECAGPRQHGMGIGNSAAAG